MRLKLSPKHILYLSVPVIVSILYFAFPQLTDKAKWQAVFNQAAALSGFQIHKISIYSSDQELNQDIKKIADPYVNKNIFLVNRSEIEKKVSSIHKVGSTIIKTSLPNELKIFIHTRTPAIVHYDQEKYKLLDKHGVVLKAYNDLKKLDGYPILIGPHSAQKIKEFLSLRQYQERLSHRILAAEYVSNYRWTLYLTNNITVHLPHYNPFHALVKLDWLDQEYDLLSREIAQIDLRNQNHVIVKRNEAIE